MNSYFQDIEHHIIKHIGFAQNRLLIAVAWFTNEKIGAAIIKKRNVDIEIITDDNEINRKSNNLINLQTHKIDITFIKDLEKKFYYCMHNKFCIIDNKEVITGSYNWTFNAKSNDENIIVVEDKINASIFSHEFRRIKGLNLPNENRFFSFDESEEIIKMLYEELKAILKNNFNKLTPGLLYNYSNERIKNKIRAVEERLRNVNLKDVPKFFVYKKLVTKYGYDYINKATESEKAAARDEFQKDGLQLTDYYLNREFQLFKLRALTKMQLVYDKIVQTHKQDNKIAERISIVYYFISKEKLTIGNSVNITHLGSF